MAIKATLETQHGETRDLYVRLNNVEASNHGMNCLAKFRGFLGEAAFRAGKAFVWEKDIAFEADVSQPLWPQAYAALKSLDPVDLPPPPAAPEPPPEGAPAEIREGYAGQLKAHEVSVADWNSACAQVEAVNVEHGALAMAEDHL